MPIPGKSITIKPTGLTDSIDGSNAFPGSMLALQDLIPNPSTRNQYVPRPAATQATNFTGFSSPGVPNVLLVLGNFAYGMIPSSRNTGQDEPFCYNITTGSFIAIAGVTAASTPTSPATTGDWTPPTMASITAGRIMITHPGYNFAGGYAVGWIDISDFLSNDITGNTNTNTTIDNLSADVLTVAGWEVGYAISGLDIPPGTTIIAIAADGLSITLSQATTNSHSGSTFTVTGGSPASPLYGAGQTSPVALVGHPVAVAQFNGRAWYAIDNSLQYSDSLIPTQITNASQAIILGDANPVNALAGLPVSSLTTGGVVQALIAFKGDSGVYQITGDQATMNLASNENPTATGTLAPNTLCDTPQGLAFISPDGLRIMSFYGVIGEPIGDNGSGVNLPFLYAINPTRMCMGYNQNTLRVSVQNGLANGEPTQEYWYHFSLKTWSGPHSFPYALIQGYQDSPNHGFIGAATGITGKLWASTATPMLNSSYVENGVPLTWTYQSTLSPDNADTAMNAVVETLLACAIPSQQSISVLALDELGNTLGSVTLAGDGEAAAQWGAFTWGAAQWGGALAPFRQTLFPWAQPLVFKQMSLKITGASLQGMVLGNIYIKYQPLGYELGPAYGQTAPPGPQPADPFILDVSLLDGPDVLV